MRAYTSYRDRDRDRHCVLPAVTVTVTVTVTVAGLRHVCLLPGTTLHQLSDP